MARQGAKIPQKQPPKRSLQYATSKAKPISHGVSKQPRKGNSGDKTVSIAGVFKDARKMPRDKKHRQIRHEEPKESKRDFAAVISEGLKEARKGIETDRKNELGQVHQDFAEILDNSRLEDRQFLQQMEEQAEILISPLGEEEIETQSILDGKRMKHVVQMGPRVREFEQKIIKESAKLADAWKQWEALQDEFVALGSEVFGVEAFPSDAKGKTQQGYRKQMELIVLEHDTRVGEINEEIETVSREALQKMKASEKDLEAAQKAEQKKLLEEMFAE